ACGHHYQAENIQNEVVNNMLYITQKHRKLYLYFMTVDKALLALRTKLKFMKKAYPYVKELEVIIGYGKSMNNAAKIKPAVENWLFQKNINFHALNPGSIAVIMKSVPDNL
uniref:Smr domain-containing protein n=1 Tax=Acrobeloides nanus TaxID=290746 RepID=A0A914D389_9BILA